jgi:hypothetical protein
MEVAVNARDLIEAWFSGLCPQQRQDVRGRLRSDDERHFAAGFWELYLHEAFTRMGYTIECHPTLAHSTRHPDYLISRGEVEFYLEATIAGQSNIEISSEKRKKRIYDLLDGLDSPNFFLVVEVEKEGRADPPTRTLRKELKAWLDSLDPGLAISQYEASHRLPAYRWEHDGWTIGFEALAKAHEHRGEPGVRPVGMLVGKGGVINDKEALLSVLKTKAGRYGHLELPYVIAVLEEGALASTQSDWHRLGALYGSLQVAWGLGSPARSTRAPDGFWVGPTGPRNTRVSAVLLVATLRPWNVTDIVPELWSNPFAQQPIHDLPALFPHKKIDIQGNQGRLVTVPAAMPLNAVLLS